MPNPTPPSALASFVGGVVSTVIFSVVYVPFTMAILAQSALTARAILPVNWQTELTGRSWLLAFSLFGFLFLFPFVLVFGLLTDSGIWSIFDNDEGAAIPFTLSLALYLSLFVFLHLITLYYSYLRPDLRVIHSQVHQFHVSASNVLALLAIVFEAFQLISPWLTIQSLGLHDDNDTSSYKQWLVQSAKVFGIGSWQEVGVNAYLETFWIAFGVIIVYAFALGYGIHSNMQPTHRAAGVLFEIIPGTFYLSIVGRLFSILNCKSDGQGGYVVQGNGGLVCWDNFMHRSMCMAALMGLLFYSSSAMFVACYRGDASGKLRSVKFKPMFLVLERTLRDLYAMTTSLISEQTLSRALSYPILIVLLSSTVSMQPCSVPSLTRLKQLSQGSAVWLLTLSFVADAFRSFTGWFDVYVPALLVYGWVGMIGIYLLYEALCVYRRIARRRVRRLSIEVPGGDVPLPEPCEEDDEDEVVPVEATAGPTSPVASQLADGQTGKVAVSSPLSVALPRLSTSDDVRMSVVAPPSPMMPISLRLPFSTRVSPVLGNGTRLHAASYSHDRERARRRPTRSATSTPPSVLRPLSVHTQPLYHRQASTTAEALADLENANAVPGVIPRDSISSSVG